MRPLDVCCVRFAGVGVGRNVLRESYERGGICVPGVECGAHGRAATFRLPLIGPSGTTWTSETLGVGTSGTSCTSDRNERRVRHLARRRLPFYGISPGLNSTPKRAPQADNCRGGAESAVSDVAVRVGVEGAWRRRR